MTGNFLLDTAVLAVSLFNAMLLLWLGLVVALNADRQSRGIWLAGGGLLCGGIFFLIHTAIIGQGLRRVTGDLDLLWQVGWLPIIASPLAWYVVMLWYTGLLGARSSPPADPVRRLHRAGLVFTLAGAGALLALVLLGGALPPFAEILTFGRAAYSGGPGTPWLIAVYAVYNVACIGLAIHALQFPRPSARWMGDLARRRARPWLTAASGVLLVVSVLVSTFVVLLYLGYSSSLAARENIVRDWIASFDGIISALIGAAVVLIGKAAVSYEIFTGKTLPRSGFLRQWRRAVILAAGYSIAVAAALGLPLSSVYVVLLATLLLVVFYALLSVRMFGERERLVRELQPFLAPPPGAGRDLAREQARAPFDTLCANVLNARVAYLVPHVPFAAPLAFPAGRAPPTPVSALTAQFTASRAPYLAIAPDSFGGALWAIPLWSERGLSGLLLLGERSDGGLYTQEEIEIAQAAGERVLQAQASAELTRRLIALQQGRLASTQVIDRRARRMLHDDILPQLHAAMLNLSGGAASDGLQQLREVHHALSNLLREMPAGGAPQVERYGLFGALRRALDADFVHAFDAVRWNVSSEAETRAQTLPALKAEVVYAAAREAIRNAAKHGRGGDKRRPLELCVTGDWRNGLAVEIQDNGVGLAAANGSSGGQGLALHSALMAVIGGAMTFEGDGGATRVTLALPDNHDGDTAT